MPSTLTQSKERKGSNFAIWQPCLSVPPLQMLVAAAGSFTNLAHARGAFGKTRVIRWPAWCGTRPCLYRLTLPGENEVLEISRGGRRTIYLRDFN